MRSKSVASGFASKVSQGLLVGLLTLVSTENRSIAAIGAVEAVILFDQAAPGTGGAVFTGFESDQVVINNSGDVAFAATSTNDPMGIDLLGGVWSKRNGSLGLVALAGQPAPGIAGNNFGSESDSSLPFGRIGITDAGAVSFAAYFEPGAGGGSFEDIGHWTRGASGLQLIARNGQVAVGMPAGTRYTALDIFPGGSAFRQGSAGFVFTDFTESPQDFYYGIWAGNAGSYSLLHRSDTPAPGTESSPFGPLNFLSLEDATIHNSGAIAFRGTADDLSEGVWKRTGGTTSLVAWTEKTYPNVPSRFASFSAPAINGAGRVAFSATLEHSGSIDDTNDAGIWVETASGLELVVQLGSQAPDTPLGAFFLSLEQIFLSEAGEVSFLGTLQPGSGGVTTDNNSGIWAGLSGSVQLVAREGNPAPGIPGATFSVLDEFTMNAHGAVAFLGTIQGAGVNSSNNTGIWAQDAFGNLVLVVRSGQLFELTPGEFLPLEITGFNAGVDDLAETRSDDAWSDSYQIAFTGTVDGSVDGIFLITVPEPGTVGLLLAGTAGVFGRRRRRD